MDPKFSAQIQNQYKYKSNMNKIQKLKPQKKVQNGKGCCRAARMKMDPAKSGSLFLLWPPLAPFAKVWLRAKPIQNRSQNAKSPPLPSPTNLKCILRNAPIKPVIKCERVSRFLIKVDLVENWVAGRFVKTSLKLHQSRADAHNIFRRELILPVLQRNPVFRFKKSTRAEELSKTSKTGDDFDDLAMTRKIVRVWNRSKVPTKSVPLKEIQPMPNCILICLGMSDKSKL